MLQRNKPLNLRFLRERKARRLSGDRRATRPEFNPAVIWTALPSSPLLNILRRYQAVVQCLTTHRTQMPVTATDAARNRTDCREACRAMPGRGIQLTNSSNFMPSVVSLGLVYKFSDSPRRLNAAAQRRMHRPAWWTEKSVTGGK